MLVLTLKGAFRGLEVEPADTSPRAARTSCVLRGFSGPDVADKIDDPPSSVSESSARELRSTALVVTFRRERSGAGDFKGRTVSLRAVATGVTEMSAFCSRKSSSSRRF